MKKYTFKNRELSWLDFNERVLQEAADITVPLIERLRFIGIFSNNLDEFYKVRYATVKRLALSKKKVKKFYKGENAKDLLNLITERAIELQNRSNLILDFILKDLEKENIFIVDEQAIPFEVHDYTIISWGSTKGPILDAQAMLKKEGIDIGFVQIKLLNPFPTEYVKSLIKDAKVLIDIEANHSGQLGKIFKQNITRDIDYHILKYTGRGITSTELYDSLKKIVENKASKREVLSHGA